MSERLHPSKENPLVIEPEPPFKAGEIFDFMDGLRKELAKEGIAIVRFNIWYPHKQPDGRLVGILYMHQKTNTGITPDTYIFRGTERDTEIIRQIDGIPIRFPLAVYTRPDGTLTGVVDVEIDGKQRILPFEEVEKGEVKKGEYRLITEIGGREIYSIRQNLSCTPDGKLVGEELKERIGGREVLYTENVAILPDGRLIGTIILEGWRSVPFVGEEVIERCPGRDKKIYSTGGFYNFPDGTIVLDLMVESRFSGFRIHEIYMYHPLRGTVLLYSSDPGLYPPVFYPLPL